MAPQPATFRKIDFDEDPNFRAGAVLFVPAAASSAVPATVAAGKAVAQFVGPKVAKLLLGFGFGAAASAAVIVANNEKGDSPQVDMPGMPGVSTPPLQIVPVDRIQEICPQVDLRVGQKGAGSNSSPSEDDYSFVGAAYARFCGQAISCTTPRHDLSRLNTHDMNKLHKTCKGLMGDAKRLVDSATKIFSGAHSPLDASFADYYRTLVSGWCTSIRVALGDVLCVDGSY